MTISWQMSRLIHRSPRDSPRKKGLDWSKNNACGEKRRSADKEKKKNAGARRKKIADFEIWPLQGEELASS